MLTSEAKTAVILYNARHEGGQRGGAGGGGGHEQHCCPNPVRLFPPGAAGEEGGSAVGIKINICFE